MNEHERRAKVLMIIQKLRELGPETAVIVEGKKDTRTLRFLGITCPIEEVNRGESLVVFAEKMAKRYSHFIVLTDWDRSGGQIARHLKDFFHGFPVELDEEIRRELANLTTKEIRTVEGLRNYVRRALNDEKAIMLFESAKK